ncbi:MAG: NAD-dependent epimerase/dehydratase family protein, partial [Planctomycetota bacterium]
AVVRGLDLRPLTNRAVEFEVGSVTCGDSVRRFVQGCDIILHTAAVVKEGGDPRLFEQINVDGTRTVVEAARSAGVRRFIHISSVMVYGFHLDSVVDEQSPLRGEGNPYCQTKIDSETMALSRHEAGEFDVTAIRCGDVYGPGSVPWTIRPVQMMKAGVFMLPDGGRGILNHVYIDNLVDGILLAMCSPKSGTAFNLTDDRATTCREFFEYYGRMLGRRRLRSAPGLILRASLCIAAGLQRLLRQEPSILPESISYLTRPGKYSVEKARAELGFEPRIDLPEGMRRTQQWLATKKLIPGTASEAL